VVERSFAWLNQMKRLAIRYERRADIHEALLTLGCSLICWRRLQEHQKGNPHARAVTLTAGSARPAGAAR
jgi:hypothetical protein